jgi:hypothetical protein
MSSTLEVGPFELVEFGQSQMADADDPAELDRLIESAEGLQ